MLTFAEMAAPVQGWKLDSLENRRSLDTQPYWEVILMRNTGGMTVAYSHRNLEMAWDGARRSAEAHDTAKSTYMPKYQRESMLRT